MEKKAFNYLKQIIANNKDSDPICFKGDYVTNEGQKGKVAYVRIQLSDTISVTFGWWKENPHFECAIRRKFSNDFFSISTVEFTDQLNNAEQDYVMYWVDKMKQREENNLIQKFESLINVEIS